jgi:hypothetical protein
MLAFYANFLLSFPDDQGKKNISERNEKRVFSGSACI